MTVASGQVYAFVCGNAVKIGYSKSPAIRLASIQACNPLRVEMAGCFTGNLDVEAGLHRRFVKYHIHGEWFRNEGEVSDWLETLRLAPDAIKDAQASDALRKHLAEKRGRLTELAQAVGITPGAVAQWKCRVPGERLAAVSRATGIVPQELRPDIFADPAQQGEAAP